MKTNTNAVAKSALGVIWLIVVMTILTEISVSFKNMLVALLWHHWVAKGIISVVVFFILYALFRKDDDTPEVAQKNALYAVVSVVLAGLVIFFFYLFDFLKG